MCVCVCGFGHTLLPGYAVDLRLQTKWAAWKKIASNCAPRVGPRCTGHKRRPASLRQLAAPPLPHTAQLVVASAMYLPVPECGRPRASGRGSPRGTWDENVEMNWPAPRDHQHIPKHSITLRTRDGIVYQC